MEVSKQNRKIKILSENSNKDSLKFLGKHLLLELYGCNSQKLNDELFLRFLINNSAKTANATVLNLISHKFEPQGVTAIALLAESHLSIHTWPESKYAAIDIFTCGKNMRPDLAIKLFIEMLEASDHISKIINRKYPNKFQ